MKGNRYYTLIMQMVKDKDLLSPDLWKYEGFVEFHISKSAIKNTAHERHMLLVGFNHKYKTNFTHLIIE